MGDVIFCKTRFQGGWNESTQKFEGGYASYNDFWNLVKWAGYETIYVDQLDPQSDNTYIVTPLNDEWINGWQNPKAQIIHWELEWRWDERANWKEPPGVSRVWHIDAYFAAKFGFDYVPIGSDEKLNELGSQYPSKKRYDVALLSYQTPRRQKVTAQLENEGLRLAPISGVWGRMRSDVLLSSECMVHVHQVENAPGIASLRWALAAAHSLPMITESVEDSGIFGYSYMRQADYDFLAKFTYYIVQDKRRLVDYGLALHNLLCRDQTFKKVVDANV